MRVFKFSAKEPIVIEGKTQLGGSGFLRFTSTPSPGVLWETSEGNWPLDCVDFESKKRRFRLASAGRYLEVAEHILPIVHAPLTGVVMDGSTWPPCFGRVSEVWDKLKPACIETEVRDDFYTINDRFELTYGIGGWRKLVIEPMKEPALRIKVKVAFKDLGEAEKTYVFPDLELLERIFRARTLGLPPWYDVLRWYPEWFSRLAKSIDVPLTRTAVWKGDVSTDMLMDTVCDHRVQDFLGALASIVPPGGMLKGIRAESICVGHPADAKAVAALRGKVVPFRLRR